MKRGLPGGTLQVSTGERPGGGPEIPEMLYAGLDLSRKRLDVHVLEEGGATREVTAVFPDADARCAPWRHRRPGGVSPSAPPSSP
jgi:hypothetical protein